MNSFKIANTEELKAVEGGGPVNQFLVTFPSKLLHSLVELASKPVATVFAPLKLVQQYLK